jgi:hypothetical protein
MGCHSGRGKTKQWREGGELRGSSVCGVYVQF